METHAPRGDVLILGGGIIGLAIALELAQRGLSVALVDRGKLGGEASSAAAGMLAPLSEVPVSGPFFEACREARDLWPDFHRRLELTSGMLVELDASGALLLADDDPSEHRLERILEAARRLGEPVAEISISEARVRVPDLARGVRRVSLLAGELRVDNRAACGALALGAEALGARLFPSTKVEKIEVGPGAVVASGNGWRREAEVLILAAGAWSGSIPGLPPLPIRPVKGQMLRLTGLEWPWAGVLNGAGGYAVRRGPSDLLVGATVEDCGFDDTVTSHGQAELRAFLSRYLPRWASAPAAASWAGLRPGTPDGLPLLGWLQEPRLLVASGHYRNGILLAPWTARAIADGLTRGTRGFPAAFDSARFR